MKRYNTYNDQNRRTVYSSPIQDIHIIGDDASIQLISFQYSLHKYGASVDGLKKGSTTQIEKVVAYLDHYFADISSDHPYIVKAVSAPTKKIPEGDNNLIQLNCSIFTENEISVYRKLLSVKPGKTISYGKLAQKAGLPNAGRFVGTAMAKNLFPILIPCHRVVKSDGRIGKYSGGPGKKEFLLKHEGYL